MLSNVAQKNILSAITLKGNAMRMRSIPDYDNVNSVINKALVEKFGEGAADHYVLVDRENFPNIKTGFGETRYAMIRYPITGPKVITSPRVIFTDEIGALIGDPTFKPVMQDGMGMSQKLVERLEGDFDIDKAYLITDPKLAKVQENINAFADDGFNNDSKAFTQQVEKVSKVYKSEDAMDIFHEASFKTFEGKTSIGKIDKQITLADIFLRMDLIDDTMMTIDKRVS